MTYVASYGVREQVRLLPNSLFYGIFVSVFYDSVLDVWVNVRQRRYWFYRLRSGVLVCAQCRVNFVVLMNFVGVAVLNMMKAFAVLL